MESSSPLLYRKVKKVALYPELLKCKPPKGKTHAIVDAESGNILSFCSEDYHLRENTDLYRPFKQYLKKQSIKFKKLYRIIEGNKFYVDFIIMDMIISTELPNILPRMTLTNSYDGTLKTQVKFGYYNKTGNNLLSRPVECKIHSSRKHSTDDDFSPEKLCQVLKRFITKEAKKDIRIFEKMNVTPAEPGLLLRIASELRLSKETKLLASSCLHSMSGKQVTYFSIYNAINHAIYNSNSKELPEIKIKRDTHLIQLLKKMF